MDDRHTGNRIVKNCIYGILAMLLFALPWLIGFLAARSVEPYQVEFPIVFLGDSIVGQCRDESSITELIARQLGVPVSNCAFGGTCMSMRERDFEDNYTMELLNMVSISRSIAAKDFGIQKTVRSRRAATPYFPEAINELSLIDYDKVEILVLEFGINDYHGAVPVEDPSDPENVTSYAGALRNVIKTLQKAYPEMKIVLVTPTYAWYLPSRQTCEEMDAGGGLLEQYVQAQLDVANELGVDVVDLYHDVYPHERFEDWMLYTEDGLHPNEDGRNLIAGILADRLRELQ